MNSVSTSTLTALIPDITISLPYWGEVDITNLVWALIVFILSYIVLWVIRDVVIYKLRSWTENKKHIKYVAVLIKAIEGISSWVYILVSIWLSVQFFSLPQVSTLLINGVLYVTLAWQAIRIISTVIEQVVGDYLKNRVDEYGNVDPNSATMSNLVSMLAKILLWSFGLIFVLSNLGIEVTSLIAGLGIGGVAIAFALQGVLSDLFASFSIYFDKPFRVGDFVVIGNDMGVVENIGIKSTRLRTLQGEELVVSNNELTTTRVQNFKKMKERRVAFEFGIAYETPAEKVKAVPQMVTEIFEKLDGGRLDRVHFTKFGDFALIYEVVFYVESPDFNEYMRIKQEFNFELMDRFSVENINFAYPTQTIFLKKGGE